MTQQYTTTPLPAGGADDAVRRELQDLRHRVPGVGGCVIAGADGLLITYETAGNADPHDLAALAAATVGVGRQAGFVLRHGAIQDSTIRSAAGYFAVYTIGDRALLAVVGSDSTNVARLHIEARSVVARLAELLPSMERGPRF